MFTNVNTHLKNRIKLILFFSLYSLIFYLPSMLIIGKGAIIMGTENTHWLLACNMLCMGLGFMSYPLSRKIFTTVETRRQAFLVLGILLLAYIFMVFGSMQAGNLVSYLLMLGGEAFLMGHLSGYVFFYMAILLQGDYFLGRILGIALAIGVVLQNIVQHFMSQVVETAALTLAITIVGMMLVLWRAPHGMVFENPLPYEKNPPMFPRQGVLGIFSVLFMAVLSALMDVRLTYLNAHEVLDEADWPRLFFALGLLLAGYLADIGRHRYLSLAATCSSVFCLPAIVWLLNGTSYNFVLCLSYAYGGFFVLYVMVFFLEIAPRTKEPALWVIMGRFVYCSANGLILSMAPKFRQFLAGNELMIVSTILVMALFVLCYLQGQPQIAVEIGKEKVGKVPLNPIERFAVDFAFTPREAEVFELLLDDKLTIQEIADKLFISRRVCQRYLTNMYEKTGTKTRLNLLLKYYKVLEK